MIIEIRNDQKKIRFNRKRVQRLIRFILRKERACCSGVTLYVTNDARMRAIHARFFGRRTPTDVMAFNATETKRPDRARGYLGDIVVSATVAKRQAARFGVTIRNEFERYVVHGLLHLLGYRDKNKKDAILMHRVQEDYLLRFKEVSSC